MSKYKKMATIGIVLIGLFSLVSCLGDKFWHTVGDIGLIGGLVLASFAYYKETQNKE